MSNRCWRVVLFSFLMLGWPMMAIAQDEPALVLARVTEAFNAHDAEALSGLVTEDVKWMSVVGDSLAFEARDRASFVASMESYFANVPGARSEVEALFVSGHHISFRERAFWKGPDGERSMTSIGVYEIQAGKVARVWYFPASP